MRGTSMVIMLCAAVFSTAALGQGTDTVKLAETWSVRTGWDMASDDAYLGTRAGCYEALTKIDFDGSLRPSLAVSWTQTSPTSWEFTLRDNVKFQDGTPLNADTASNALNQLLKATVPARVFSPKLVKSVEAVGDKIVRITTIEPSVLLPLQVASPATSILSPAAYKDGKVDPTNTCTGPFIITRVDASQGMTLKRNDAYWGERPALAGIEVRFILDPNGRATQIRTSEADIARMVPPYTLGQLRRTAGVALAEVTAPRTLILLLNNKKPPLDDVRVRRAIQAAIDTAGIAAAVYEGSSPPAMGPFRPTDPWAPSNQHPTYDVALAKKLLADAGIAPGTLKLGLLAYSSKAELKDVAAIVQEQLKQIGIEINIRLAEYNAIEPDMLSGNFDMAFMSRGYMTDVPEPIGFLSADYSCSGSFNMSHYCSAETDAAIKLIFQTADQQKRFAAYSALAEKLQSEAISVFIVHETLYNAYSTRVQKYRPHQLNYYEITPSVSLQ